MLSNCKRKRIKSDDNLPLGVCHDKKSNKYYGEITPCGQSGCIQLHNHDTVEEAFAEYKRFKQADVLLMAAKYKNRIPESVYEALLKYEVKPF